MGEATGSLQEQNGTQGCGEGRRGRGHITGGESGIANGLVLWLNLGGKGWYTKRMGEWRTEAVQDSGLCGRKCDAPNPPARQYVFSLARVSLFPLPTMLF